MTYLVHHLDMPKEAEQEIHVLTHHIQEFYHPAYKHFMAQLPLPMKAEIMSYRFHCDRVRKTVGRLLLNEALKADGLDIKLLQKTPYGKPYIKGWYPFSLSHSEQMVALVYATNISITGIDVEFIKDIDVQSMYSQLHSDEINSIQSVQDPLKGFYEIWTRKEAVVKAQGIGLTDYLPELNCSGSSTLYDGKKWYFSPIYLGKEYAASVVSEYQNTVVKVKSINLG